MQQLYSVISFIFVISVFLRQCDECGFNAIFDGQALIKVESETALDEVLPNTTQYNAIQV